MTARESFACYRDGDGNVIALDKTGFCVTESLFLPWAFGHK